MLLYMSQWTLSPHPVFGQISRHAGGLDCDPCCLLSNVHSVLMVWGELTPMPGPFTAQYVLLCVDLDGL